MPPARPYRRVGRGRLGPERTVTRGGDPGSQGAYAAGPVDLPGVPVDEVDTVGAGDAFMSRLLAAAPTDVDRMWQAFLRRFDIEHTFHLFKQTLGWTCPKIHTASG